MADVVRIGNAQAFWGDRTLAAAEMLALEPGLDFLTLDYLAEVSMSILALQRDRDPGGGFARDFLDVVRSLLPYWSSGGSCRVITNAGGLNPFGCAEACRALIEEAGCRALRIGIVSGDDVLNIVRVAADCPGSQEFKNLDTGARICEIAERLVSANTYLGAEPIVEALAQGADLIITGRVADPSLAVAACVHAFGWEPGDFDRLAGATVAGHLIECGTQVTGGTSTDWLDLPDPAHMGFPIVEVSKDGTCVVTKPRGTGGRVTELTVKEQLVYEIADPSQYLSPDVTVSFESLRTTDLGEDRVQVDGAVGKQRPQALKVSATFRDGYWAAGTLTIVGRGAELKARRCGELVLQRLREAGCELRDSLVECLGSGELAAGILRSHCAREEGLAETVLRVAVEAESRDAVQQFTRELMPLITAGPAGTTGYREGRPRVQPLFRFWPCLISRSEVRPRVEIITSKDETRRASCAAVKAPPARSPARVQQVHSRNVSVPSSIYNIACARSGDKGSNVNIGVIARRRDAWDFLRKWLTAECVAEFFSPLGIEAVERFELPNLEALNFVLYGVLRRGLGTDSQGKTLGQILLEMPLPADFQRSVQPLEKRSPH
jgi:hypothetical protein